MAQTTIANYEKKARFPDEEMLGRLADFFDVGFDFLMGRSPLQRGPAERHDEPAGAFAKPRVPEIAARYLALLRGNSTQEASELVESEAANGRSLEEIYLGVLEPALKETGRLWELGELGVGEEHTISTETQRIMARLFAERAPAAAAGQPRCLVLSTAGEQHLIGAAMVTDLLRLAGWEVVFPGGNLATRHALELVAEFRPRLIALSITMPAHASAAADLVASVRAKSPAPGPWIMAGGQAFEGHPGMWREIGADATAGDAASAVTAAKQLFEPREGAGT